MSAAAIPRLSVEEYLTADRAAEVKSEYHDGEMFPIVAASAAHAEIVGLVAFGLIGKLRGGHAAHTSPPCGFA
ncbi:MAG: hypothetical protein U0Q16_33110 [Bryobacteraceae bacterium]